MTSNRLARLVRIKHLAEQARVTELAERKQSLEAARSELAEAEARLDAVDASVDHSDPSSMLFASAFRDHLAGEIQQQESVVRQRVESVQTAEGSVREAWTDRRQLETARDNAVEREAQEETRREHLRMEELALTLRRKDQS